MRVLLDIDWCSVGFSDFTTMPGKSGASYVFMWYSGFDFPQMIGLYDWYMIEDKMYIMSDLEE